MTATATAWRMGEWWTNLGSTLASVMFLWAVIRQYVPHRLQEHLTSRAYKLLGLLSPNVHITFNEYVGERLRRSEAFTAIESYLSSSCSESAKRLKAEVGKDSASLVLSMDDLEEVHDVFDGIKLRWSSSVTSTQPRPQPFSFYREPMSETRRHYRLTFHRRQRKMIIDKYLRHVLEEGKAIGVRQRRRKLYTNNPNYDYFESRRTMWSHVPFEHPATFETLAMDPEKKREIVQDLLTFTKGKEYYARVGKPWKRGYLLYGPPGTGKSTMISAMANLLDYDVYDLELTAVKCNTTLRKLLIETTAKSIIVIEDIDCSLDLAGRRKAEGKEEEERKKPVGREDKEESKVTLSGLLNFIDGLWSSCGGERLIVFTTNHLEKLDPALIRKGRMDKHVELSYCGFEGFKVLARNYLGIEDHPRFDRIKEMMEEVKITPADVAENLMPKSVVSVEKNIEACLESLVQAMEECKLKAKLDQEKEEEEKTLKAKLDQEKEEKEKALKDKPKEEEEEKTLKDKRKEEEEEKNTLKDKPKEEEEEKKTLKDKPKGEAEENKMLKDKPKKEEEEKKTLKDKPKGEEEEKKMLEDKPKKEEEEKTLDDKPK